MSGDLACTYAALILSDDGQEVTGDKMDSIIKAKGAHSLRVSRTNSHAGEEHFALGTSTPWMRDNNEQADSMARIGITEQADGLFELPPIASRNSRWPLLC